MMYPNIVQISNLIVTRQTDLYTIGEGGTSNNTLIMPRELVGKFDGLNTLFDYQAEYQATGQRDNSSDKSKTSGFTVFHNYLEARELYKNNPASIAKFIQRDTVIEGGESSGRDIEYDVTGDILDIGRYLSGEPEVFGSLTNGNPRNKRVNILINLSWWFKVPDGTINERSKRIIRLIDWLESQGIRTQVVGISSNTDIHIEIIVKHFDESLNINDIAIISHSDFLRRILFRFTEYSQTYSGNYGSADYLSKHFQNNAKLYASDSNDEYTILVDGGMETNIINVDKQFDKVESDLLTALADNEPAKVFNVINGLNKTLMTGWGF